MKGMNFWWIGYSTWMTEWWWNEMSFWFKGFALIQKILSFHPHSVISSSFLSDETDGNEVKMSRMTIEWNLFIVIFIPWHSNMFSNDWGMTEWGRMMVFLKVNKKTEFWDTSHSGIIPSFQPHSSELLKNGKIYKKGMMLKWQKWPLNDLIWCCLFKRDSTILNHSDPIPVIPDSFWQ